MSGGGFGARTSPFAEAAATADPASAASTARRFNPTGGGNLFVSTPSLKICGIKPFIKVTEHSSGCAPDKSLLIFHRVELNAPVPPFAKMPHVVLFGHQER